MQPFFLVRTNLKFIPFFWLFITNLNAQTLAQGGPEAAPPAVELDMGGSSLFTRAWEGGPIVFGVLVTLILCSIYGWAVIFSKMRFLKKLTKESETFSEHFWKSGSVNDFNGRLGEYPASPMKEIFRSGYAELVKGSQLREQLGISGLMVDAAMANMSRALNKVKFAEKRKMETHLSSLATIASVSPFVGLFGTVWGIMGAFEGIAQSGSASLAAVAPGISEALIATAFGLAAAIPAVIGYNFAQTRIRNLSGQMDAFIAEFSNLIHRYLVSDRSKGSSVPQGL